MEILVSHWPPRVGSVVKFVTDKEATLYSGSCGCSIRARRMLVRKKSVRIIKKHVMKLRQHRPKDEEVLS